jgi:hypothetical protein
MQLAAPRPVVPLEKLELESDNPRQREYNEAILQRLEAPDDTARDRVEDAIQFAKWMRPNQPNADVFVSPEPVIRLSGEQNGQKLEISISHGNFDFYVNDSPHVTLESVPDRVAVAFKLHSIWKTLIAHLPEGFVIYGPDANPGSQDSISRDNILVWLGFGATEANGDRFGIIRDHKVTPLTGVEFAEMAGEEGTAILYNQRFMVEEIVWNNPE